uniref:G-protein coupled receptors family 1 profile domain-containing protein n=1 Tax=Leptobrachium leishanense TaxID=445787 RepID=A0A8C5N434_9ANUR
MQNSSTCFVEEGTAKVLMEIIYVTVLILGPIGIVLMIYLMNKPNSLSITTTAIINLLVIHSIFLLTVPFRLVYYFKGRWLFEYTFCKIVSAMIHIHLYTSFFFYVEILVIRHFSYFTERDNVSFNRRLHAVSASVIAWAIVLAFILPAFIFYDNSDQYNGTECFTFQNNLNESTRNLNYVIVVFVLFIVCVLLAVQCFILVKVAKKLQVPLCTHQEFWVELKSLAFILVMIVFFFPSLLFRTFYLQHLHCSLENEIFLSLSALSCLDRIVFFLNYYIGGCLCYTTIMCTLWNI